MGGGPFVHNILSQHCCAVELCWWEQSVALFIKNHVRAISEVETTNRSSINISDDTPPVGLLALVVEL